MTDSTRAIFRASSIGGLNIEAKHSTITGDWSKHPNASRCIVDAEKSRWFIQQTVPNLSIDANVVVGGLDGRHRMAKVSVTWYNSDNWFAIAHEFRRIVIHFGHTDNDLKTFTKIHSLV